MLSHGPIIKLHAKMSWYYKNYFFWKFKRADHWFFFYLGIAHLTKTWFLKILACPTAPTPLVIDGHSAINLQVWAWGSGPYNEIFSLKNQVSKKNQKHNWSRFFPWSSQTQLVFLRNFFSGLSLGLPQEYFTSRVHTYYNKFHDFLSDDHNAS